MSNHPWIFKIDKLSEIKQHFMLHIHDLMLQNQCEIHNPLGFSQSSLFSSSVLHLIVSKRPAWFLVLAAHSAKKLYKPFTC